MRSMYVSPYIRQTIRRTRLVEEKIFPAGEGWPAVAAGLGFVGVAMVFVRRNFYQERGLRAMIFAGTLTSGNFKEERRRNNPPPFTLCLINSAPLFCSQGRHR